MDYPQYSHPAVSLLDELLSIPSPPGYESEMAAYLCQKIKSLGWNPEVDSAGNVIVRCHRVEGTEPVILGAHMDEIALVVSAIEPDGRLRVKRSGGMAPQKLGERPVQILGETSRVTGIVSSGTGHTGGKEKAWDWTDYWVLTGLNQEQLQKAGVYPGSPIVPVREGRGPLLLGDKQDPLLAAWTMDDRMGVVTLLRLLEYLAKNKPVLPRSLIIAFTVHEEGGAHGVKFLCNRERPEQFIAVDGCPIAQDSNLKMDERPVIWSKDTRANYDPRLLKELAQSASAAGCTLQRVVLDNAWSDASDAYACGTVGRIAIIGHARENSHGFEVARLAVFDNLLRVLEQFVVRIS